MINEQGLWGKNHNYVEIVIDDKPIRIQNTEKNNQIIIAQGLSNTVHTLMICKNTEANIGYMEFIGLKCESLFTTVA